MYRRFFPCHCEFEGVSQNETGKVNRAEERRGSRQVFLKSRTKQASTRKVQGTSFFCGRKGHKFCHYPDRKPAENEAEVSVKELPFGTVRLKVEMSLNWRAYWARLQPDSCKPLSISADPVVPDAVLSWALDESWYSEHQDSFYSMARFVCSFCCSSC